MNKNNNLLNNKYFVIGILTGVYIVLVVSLIIALIEVTL